MNKGRLKNFLNIIVKNVTLNMPLTPTLFPCQAS